MCSVNLLHVCKIILTKYVDLKEKIINKKKKSRDYFLFSNFKH